MNVDLREKVALVTGGAHGIGLATARVLAANGAQVILSDLDESAAIAAASEIPFARPLRMDVSNQAEVEAGTHWIESNCGHLDILINNAGLNTINHRVTIDQFPPEEWDKIMNVDLRGLFLVSRSATALMLRNGGGRVVNISSVLGLVPARLQCAFTAAKAGVINLTRAMAIELAPKGILVNCVAPGSTMTQATEALFYGEDGIMRERVQRMIAHVPIGRAGQPDEIANAILFLASPESSYITGQILCVDGGWSAGGFMRDF
jgi:3-oxoacyl-[acyl-carrier protein] reductase